MVAQTVPQNGQNLLTAVECLFATLSKVAELYLQTVQQNGQKL